MESLLNVKDALVGWVPNRSYGYRYPAARGLRVTVSVSMERHDQEQETVFHGKAAGLVRFSLTTAVWRPDGQDWTSGGATVKPLHQIVKFAPGITSTTIRRLCELHDGWHLNDMKAACAHQAVPEVPDDVSRLDATGWLLANVPPCPETGYRWGRSWLAEPLPDYLTPAYVRGLLSLEA